MSVENIKRVSLEFTKDNPIVIDKLENGRCQIKFSKGDSFDQQVSRLDLCPNTFGELIKKMIELRDA